MEPHLERIERYQAAYRAINGESPYRIEYERGWYTFSRVAGFPSFRKRKDDVDRMIATLEYRKRSKSRPTDKEHGDGRG